MLKTHVDTTVQKKDAQRTTWLPRDFAHALALHNPNHVDSGTLTNLLMALSEMPGGLRAWVDGRLPYSYSYAWSHDCRVRKYVAAIQRAFADAERFNAAGIPRPANAGDLLTPPDDGDDDAEGPYEGPVRQRDNDFWNAAAGNLDDDDDDVDDDDDGFNDDDDDGF